MIQIALCDDSTAFCTQFEKQLTHVATEIGIEVMITVFHDCNALLKQLKVETYHIIFLDIEFSAETAGITAAHIMRDKMKQHITEIVFISSHSQYCEQLFDVQPMTFINKLSLSSEQIKRVFTRYQERHNWNSYFPCMIDGRKINIPYNDILYFEFKDKHECIIQLYDTAYTIILRTSFSNFAETISKYHFFKISRSCCINPSYIQKIDGAKIIFQNGHMQVISRRMHTDFLKFYAKECAYGNSVLSDQ